MKSKVFVLKVVTLRRLLRLWIVTCKPLSLMVCQSIMALFLLLNLFYWLPFSLIAVDIVYNLLQPILIEATEIEACADF